MTPRVADLSPAAASFHNSIPPAKQNRHGTSRTMSFERSPSGMRGTRGTRAGPSALAASGHINRRTPKGALPEATGHCLCAAASKSRPAQRPAAPRWTPERCRGLSRIHGDARASPRPSGSGPTRRSRRARWTRAVERPRPGAGPRRRHALSTSRRRHRREGIGRVEITPSSSRGPMAGARSPRPPRRPRRRRAARAPPRRTRK